MVHAGHLGGEDLHLRGGHLLESIIHFLLLCQVVVTDLWSEFEIGVGVVTKVTPFSSILIIFFGTRLLLDDRIIILAIELHFIVMRISTSDDLVSRLVTFVNCLIKHGLIHGLIDRLVDGNIRNCLLFLVICLFIHLHLREDTATTTTTLMMMCFILL